MRWVQQAAMRPHHCALIPYIANANARKGFFDAGTDLPGFDPHVYISVDAAEEMARLLGWQPGTAEATALARSDEKDRRIAELEAEVAELNKEFDAIDVLESAGLRARRRAGRKPKVAA